MDRIWFTTKWIGGGRGRTQRQGQLWAREGGREARKRQEKKFLHFLAQTLKTKEKKEREMRKRKEGGAVGRSTTMEATLEKRWRRMLGKVILRKTGLRR